MILPFHLLKKQLLNVAIRNMGEAQTKMLHFCLEKSPEKKLPGKNKKVQAVQAVLNEYILTKELNMVPVQEQNII